jgi:hypothetical protein
MVIATSGCVSRSILVCVGATKVGYYPENVGSSDYSMPPSYGEVRTWAEAVADGYDSRHTMNRHALYVGALTAVAAVGAIAGLSVFAPGSSALVGVPIGTAFLSGVFSVYHNEQKALIYDQGARAIKDVIALSDYRTKASEVGGTGSDGQCAGAIEAVCLREDVNRIMREVSARITLTDPTNVPAALKGVADKAVAASANVVKLTGEYEAARKTAASANTADKPAADAAAKQAADALDKARSDQATANAEVVAGLAQTLNPTDIVPATYCCVPPGYHGPVTQVTTTTSTTVTTLPPLRPASP